MTANPPTKSQQRATDDLSWALRDMTCNLLRVVRGAGQSALIFEQIATVQEALTKYQVAYPELSRPPSHELNDMLRYREDERRAHDPVALVRAGLRIAAAQLVGDLLQQRNGENDLREARDR